MEVSLPDPITNYNRQAIRQRYQRREEYILGHHPGFNLLYWQRIIRAPRRVERWGRHLGWNRDQIMLTKALLITRMACIFIDHIIRRMDEADLLEPSPHSHQEEWERQYRNFLRLFLQVNDVPDRRDIVKLMQRLHRYTIPPAFLLDFRQRHWRRIEQCLAPLLNPSGAASLFIRRQFSGQSNPVFTARRICFTAALYSDIQERLYQQQWIFAYSDCMLRLYDQLRQHPAVLTAILGLR